MPGSSHLFDDDMKKFLIGMGGPVLDIGPGSGKMGIMAKDAKCSPVDCIEVHCPYVNEFGLKGIYDNVEVGDAYDLIKHGNRAFGTVIFGDVIEHMPKSRGRDLLEYLVIRSDWILVKYPVQTNDAPMYQGESHGNKHEAHISLWSKEDFHGFDVEHREDGPMRLAIIRGYRPR